MNWDEIGEEDTNVIMHVYRGEVQRINTWRQRMDRSTNWAIVITVGVITFALSGKFIPHWTLMPGLFLVFILLFTEARRYRHYDSWRGRVRVFEELFLAKFFDRDFDIDERWAEILSDDLRQPRFKITWAEAVKKRLKRIYIWIILVFVATWVGKIYVHPTRIASAESFFMRVSGGTALAGKMIFGGIIGSIILFVAYFFLMSPEDDEAKGVTKEKQIDKEFGTEEYMEKFEEEKNGEKNEEEQE